MHSPASIFSTGLLLTSHGGTAAAWFSPQSSPAAPRADNLLSFAKFPVCHWLRQ